MKLSAEKNTLITCFLPKGKGHLVVKALHDEKEINTADVTSGRGLGTAGRVSFGTWAEFDILTVAVEKKLDDEVFDFIYETADMHRPHGGIIFTHPLSMTSTFILPDEPEEGEKVPEELVEEMPESKN